MNELEQRAREHKKKNKGLSRYCYLNPNAGNVEHNIDMFNKANSPVDGPTNNPISGPFGGDVSTPATTCGVSESLEVQNDNQIELEYINVPVIEYGSKRGVDDWDEIERHIDYTYTIDKNSVAECLTDIVAEQEPELVFAMTDEQFDNWIDEHFDEYFQKYHEMVKEFYYEDAQHEAQETFEPSEYFVESAETEQGKHGHEFDSLYRLMQAQHLTYLFHQGTLLDTLLSPYADGDLTVFETFAKAPEDVQFRVVEAMKKALHAHAKSLDDNFDMWLGYYTV